MERKEVAGTRFFKVMMSGFQHKLKLPAAISKELRKEKSGRAALQSRLGTWKMSMCSKSENENDDLICFNQGWPQFVDRHALSVGDFLYFVHTGDLHFHVYVFDRTACEKEFRQKDAIEALIPTKNSSRGKMGEEHEISIRSKFFRIMLTGFWKRLKLPPDFCEKVITREKSKRAILESCKGRWVVNVCKKDDQIFLEDGWPRFAHEHGLTLGDLLVFEHTGKLQFNVVVCNSTGCEKKFLVEPHNNDNEHQTINPIYHAKKLEMATFPSQSPCFSHKMTYYTVTSKKTKVSIPVEFVKSNNLGQKKGAILKDPQSGRKWRMKLGVQNWPRFRMTMTLGWHDFVAANNLEVGDLCTFKLNPTKTSTSENISFDVCISRNTNR